MDSLLGTVHLRKNKSHIVFHQAFGVDVRNPFTRCERNNETNDKERYVYICLIDMVHIDIEDVDAFNDLEIFYESDIESYDSDFIDMFVEGLLSCGFKITKK